MGIEVEEPFANRRGAARRLAARLIPLWDGGPIVVALPRGGVPAAKEAIDALTARADAAA